MKMATQFQAMMWFHNKIFPNKTLINDEKCVLVTRDLMWQEAWHCVTANVTLRDRSQEMTKPCRWVFGDCSCLASVGLSPHWSEDFTADKAIVHSAFYLWERGLKSWGISEHPLLPVRCQEAESPWKPRSFYDRRCQEASPWKPRSFYDRRCQEAEFPWKPLSRGWISLETAVILWPPLTRGWISLEIAVMVQIAANYHPTKASPVTVHWVN